MSVESKSRRHEKTVQFMLDNVPKESRILDLGEDNVLSYLLRMEGYNVKNTDFDLDLCPEKINEYKVDVVTGFEILEHLIEPAQVLKNIKASTMVMSVPLMRMFDKTYWNDDDERDQHYHEFTVKQFDKLLEYSGWKILKGETWKSYSSLFGQFLQRQPRFYIVHCYKKG